MGFEMAAHVENPSNKIAYVTAQPASVRAAIPQIQLDALLQILVFAENSALDRAPWGAGGRRFKSSRPDQYQQGFAGFYRKPHLTNSAGTPGFPDGNAWRVLRLTVGPLTYQVGASILEAPALRYPC